MYTTLTFCFHNIRFQAEEQNMLVKTEIIFMLVIDGKLSVKAFSSDLYDIVLERSCSFG